MASSGWMAWLRGGGQVGADQAVAGGGADAAPAAADLHLEFDHALWLLAGVGGERHGEIDGESPGLRGAGLQTVARMCPGCRPEGQSRCRLVRMPHATCLLGFAWMKVVEMAPPIPEIGGPARGILSPTPLATKDAPDLPAISAARGLMSRDVRRAGTDDVAAKQRRRRRAAGPALVRWRRAARKGRFKKPGYRNSSQDPSQTSHHRQIGDTAVRQGRSQHGRSQARPVTGRSQRGFNPAQITIPAPLRVQRVSSVRRLAARWQRAREERQDY
jgi:hypothetical protein